MFQELLFALLGYTGDLIIDEREQRLSIGLDVSQMSDECTFTLAPDISFLQTSERDVIQRLITLGFYYKELEQYATKSRDLSWIHYAKQSPLSHSCDFQKKQTGKPSMYRRAVANGVVEILSLYRSAVLLVEQKLLSDPLPILATITQGLNKFHIILPPLYKLVLEIERNDVRGGQLLSLLHKRCHCGVPELQSCLQRILWHGHQVLYHQLSSWLVYGILHDQHGEFFIGRHEERESDNELFHQDKLETSTQQYTTDASMSDWHLGFHIVWDMLPEYIHQHVAESILFSGKAVRVLRNLCSSSRSQDAAIHHQVRRGTNKLRALMAGSCSHKESRCTLPLEEDLLPQFEADKIDGTLHKLKESSEFHKRSFEAAVDSIRMIAASYLWQLVVEHANLNGHLRALKDFFLLAKGDFFQCFLEESRQLMRLPCRQSTVEADLLVPFQLAALKTIADDDDHFQRISLRISSFGAEATSQLEFSKLNMSDRNRGGISELSASSTECSSDGWDGIVLEYLVNWPLHLFFTQEVISKYQRVFQYLLKLKRAQMELEKSWGLVMHLHRSVFSKHKSGHGSSSPTWQGCLQSQSMWWIREHMAFLIRNLQFYIQLTVGVVTLGVEIATWWDTFTRCIFLGIELPLREHSAYPWAFHPERNQSTYYAIRNISEVALRRIIAQFWWASMPVDSINKPDHSSFYIGKA